MLIWFCKIVLHKFSVRTFINYMFEHKYRALTGHKYWQAVATEVLILHTVCHFTILKSMVNTSMYKCDSQHCIAFFDIYCLIISDFLLFSALYLCTNREHLLCRNRSRIDIKLHFVCYDTVLSHSVCYHRVLSHRVCYCVVYHILSVTVLFYYILSVTVLFYYILSTTVLIYYRTFSLFLYCFTTGKDHNSLGLIKIF